MKVGDKVTCAGEAQQVFTIKLINTHDACLLSRPAGEAGGEIVHGWEPLRKLAPYDPNAPEVKTSRVFAVYSESEEGGTDINVILSSEEKARAYVDAHDEPDDDGYGWLVIQEFETDTGKSIRILDKWKLSERR